MNHREGGGFEEDYFRRYYPDYARQNPDRKLQFYRSLAERAAAGLQRPRILELGCAFGRFLSVVNPEWHRFGLDASHFAIDQARRAVPQAQFAVGRAPDIPFEGTFDIIAAFDVLEHLEDLDSVAGSLKARLAPQGSFVFVVPVYDGPTGPLIHLLDRDVTHRWKQSRRFWLAWTNRHFRLIDWWGIYRYLLPWGWYLHRPTKHLRWGTPAIAVVSRTQESPPAP